MPTLLKKLGIPSPRHAAEIERDLGIRFSDFTPEHCDTWTEQTLYLYQFAQTRTTTHAARTAGITLAAARQWQSDNTLGFNQRLDDAVLEYTDDMEVLFLERTRQPDSPTSFMTTLLRAQMPEKYGPARRSTPSRDNHCDHDRGDDQDSEHTPAPSNNNQPSLADIQRQLEQLQHLTDKAQTPPTPISPPTGERHREGALPHPTTLPISPPTDQAPVGAGFKPLSPHGRDHTSRSLPQRGRRHRTSQSLPPRGRDTERGRSHTQRRFRSLPHRPGTRRGRFQTCPCSLPNHGRDHTSRSLPQRGRRHRTSQSLPRTGERHREGALPHPTTLPISPPPTDHP